MGKLSNLSEFMLKTNTHKTIFNGVRQINFIRSENKTKFLTHFLVLSTNFFIYLFFFFYLSSSLSPVNLSRLRNV